MIFFILLLGTLTGVQCSEHFFSEGNEYQYSYTGRIMSGIPDLAPQYAGLMIKANIILQAFPDNWFHMMVKDVSFNSFNKNFRNMSATHWKTVQIKDGWSEADPSSLPSLQIPIKFTMRNGILSDIIVSTSEPEWVLNFKKALVSLFKVQEDQNNLNKPGTQHTWKVKEDGIDGVCETTYNVNQIPFYQIKSKLLRKKCFNENIYEISKTRNFNHCLKSTAFNVNQPGNYKCSKGNCTPNWQRNFQVKYINCGKSLKTSTMHSVSAEGEIQQKLLSTEDKPNMAGTLQDLQLTLVTNKLSKLRNIDEPRQIDNVLYEFKKITQIKKNRSKRNTIILEHEENILNQKHPKRSLLYTIPIDVIMQRVIDDVATLDRDIKSYNWNSKQYLATKILPTSDIISLLETGHLEAIYANIKTNEMKSIFVDIVVMTGTNHALRFIMNLIKSDKLTVEKAISTISSIPHYVQTPTQDLMEEMFSLVNSEAVRRHDLVRHTSNLAFATLINKACVDRRRHQNYPLHALGMLCHDSTQLLTNKYLPYFVNQYENANDKSSKLSSILCLTNLAHDSVLPHVIQCMLGTTCDSQEQTFALHSLDHEKMFNLRDMKFALENIIYNKEEKAEVRIAAVTSYLQMTLPFYKIQMLVSSLSNEEDRKIASFMSSVIHEMYELDNRAMHASQLHQLSKQIKKAVRNTEIKFDKDMKFFLKSYEKSINHGYFMKNQIDNSSQLYIREEGHHQNYQYSKFEIFCSTIPNASTESEVAFLWLKMYGNMQIALGPIDVKAFTFRIVLNVNNYLTPGLLLNNFLNNALDIQSFHQTKVFDSSPNEVIIPSEIGLPYLLELHTPTIINTQDNSANDEVNFNTFINTAKSGYLGTLCPFTNRILAGGLYKQVNLQFIGQATGSTPPSYIDESVTSKSFGYTCAKNINLIEMVHEIEDDNTLQINSNEATSFDDTTEIWKMVESFVSDMNENEDNWIEEGTYDLTSFTEFDNDMEMNIDRRKDEADSLQEIMKQINDVKNVIKTIN